MNLHKRVNVRLEERQYNYLSHAAWRNRSNMTEYVRYLISEDIEKWKAARDKEDSGF